MKKSFLSLLLSVCLLLSLLACSQLVKDKNKGEKVYLFDPGAESFAMNMSLTSIMWGTGNCGTGKTAIPVHQGDLLYIIFSDTGKVPAVVQYDEKFGISGLFSTESENEYSYLYRMNDSVIQLNLAGLSGAWKWLEDAQPEDLKTIKSLFFTGEIGTSPYHLLQKIADVNSSPGLCFENPGQLLKVLPMFQPAYLLIGKWDPVDEKTADDAYALLKSQHNLKKVYFLAGGKDPAGSLKPGQDFRFLSSLPSLQSIMMFPSLFNQLTTTSLPETVMNVEELIICSQDNNNEIKDLSVITAFKNIKQFRCIMTDIVCSVEDLYHLPGLSSLSFTGSNVLAFPEIKEMPDLKWFSFPKNTDQAYFQAFLEKNPGIEYLEITGCENITDLSPLTYVTNLKGLVLIDMEIEDYSPLYTLNNPEFLILPSDLFKEDRNAEVDELKKRLPDSALICGEPFCLGSGWILLFPLIMLFCFAAIILLKRYRIHWRKEK